MAGVLARTVVVKGVKFRAGTTPPPWAADLIRNTKAWVDELPPPVVGSSPATAPPVPGVDSAAVEAATAKANEASALATSAQAQVAQLTRVAGSAVQEGRADRSELWEQLTQVSDRVRLVEQAIAAVTAAEVAGTKVDLYPLIEQLSDRLGALERTPGPAGENGLTPEFMAGADALLWRYPGGEWQTLLAWQAIRGADGRHGVDGRPVEMSVHDGAVRWRREGEPWQPLLSLTDLHGKPGVDGRPVELRSSDGQVQWRREGGTWNALVSHAALREPVDAVQARVASVVLPLPKLTGGAGQDITVTWTTPMPSAAYRVDFSVEQALLGRVSWSVKSQSATDVVITVKALQALTGPASAVVLAVG